jgi:hypothetical protein
MKWLAGHLSALRLPKGAHLLARRARDSTNAPPTSCEPSNCLSRDGARRSVDGVSPSGVSTVDDRLRLGVRPMIGHASPRRTAAAGCQAFGVPLSPRPWKHFWLTVPVFYGMATRRFADGGSPSGVGTIDDRRRVAVPPIIDHDSPWPTRAEGCQTFGVALSLRPRRDAPLTASAPCRCDDR